MTSLIAWAGVDSRGPASIYLASDSRISWENRGTWDFSRKLFASTSYPDILGYFGDVLFTSRVLGQVVDLIDAQSLFTADAEPESKFAAIIMVFKQAHLTYPEGGRRPFSVFHCSRRGKGMATRFALFELSWDLTTGWQNKAIPVSSERSALVVARGSGEKSVLKWLAQWDKSEVGRTSRSIFSAFCDALASGADAKSGGAPQLVGIYREGSAKSFGVIHKGNRYLHGLCVDSSPWLGSVEWRNELFERCDWRTREKLDSAQRQPRPRRL